jgi:predicted transcriptional regulator
MEALWDAPTDTSGAAGWMTVREVHGVLSAKREIAYTTVMTVLDRLTRKDLVRREREGRAYRYRPADDRGAMTAEAMRGALDQVASSDRTAALVAFVGEASDADRAALREALARLE